MVKIIADSASDLPLTYYQENDVALFPLKVLLQNNEYEDIKTIEPKQVYDAIRTGEHPKTSQPSPSVMESIFTKMAENNEDGIYIAFSSELSGTYQSAVLVLELVKEKYPNFNLTIIDTKCASLGAGLIVKEAVRMAKASFSKEEIIKRVEFLCAHMEHLVTVEDLEYLVKGGRVSKASAFLGGLLNIKPLLHVESGKLVPIEKIRGKKKLLRRMLELIQTRGIGLSEQTIGISHADDEETALEVKNLIEQEIGPKEIIITSIGAAIGSHTGQGTIGIFFLNALPE